MCREGAWAELTAKVTLMRASQNQPHGFFIAFYVIKLIFKEFLQKNAQKLKKHIVILQK